MSNLNWDAPPPLLRKPSLHTIGFLVAFVFCLQQILLGGDGFETLFIATSIVLGFSAISNVGISSLLGVLLSIYYFRYIIFSVILKNYILFTPVETSLNTPFETTLVFLLGSASVWLFSLVWPWLANRRGLFDIYLPPGQEGLLGWVFLTLGTISMLGVRSVADDELVGGIWGVLKQYTSFSTYSIVAFMYAARGEGRNALIERRVLLSLFLSIALGLLSTSKQRIIEPILCYILIGFIFNGFSDKKLLLGSIFSLVFFAGFVYPYSQYSRYFGGRETGIMESGAAVFDISYKYVTDPQFRDLVTRFTDNQFSSAKTNNYLPSGYAWAARFSMLGEMDKLVSATEKSGHYTGWDTIQAGFDIVVPSFINEGKIQNLTGNFLGRYVGELGEKDYTTQVSYGFMGNLFNAYSYIGVMAGCFSLLFFVFGFMSLFWSLKSTNSIWGLFLLLNLHQLFVEGAVAHIISFIRLPINTLLVLFFFFTLKLIAKKNNSPSTISSICQSIYSPKATEYNE